MKRNGKRKETAIWGMVGQIAEEEKEFSEEGAIIWARKLDRVAIDTENKILYVLKSDQREEYEEGARL